MALHEMANRKSYEKYLAKHFPELTMREVYVFQKEGAGTGGLFAGTQMYYIYDIGEEHLFMFTFTFDILSIGEIIKAERLERAVFAPHPKRKKSLVLINTQYNDGVYRFVTTTHKKGYSKQQWLDFFVNNEYRYSM
jgi:hypothetical protein